MLYEADRHEPLTSTQWDEFAVRHCIERIVRDAVAHYSPKELWPSHPLEFSPDARWNLYVGAAGVMWALNHLADAGFSIDLPEISKVVRGFLEPNRSWIRDGKNIPLGTNGLLMGDVGILLLEARLGELASVVDQIGLAIDANQDNPGREFMWGSPGTALACLWLYDWTGKGIWADRFRRDVAILWERLELFEAAGCYLWTQNLYGHQALHLGAVHGFAGNAFPVIRGWQLLSPVEQSRWAERLEESLRRTAIWEERWANWPQSVGRCRAPWKIAPSAPRGIAPSLDNRGESE